MKKLISTLMALSMAFCSISAAGAEEMDPVAEANDERVLINLWQTEVLDRDYEVSDPYEDTSSWVLDDVQTANAEGERVTATITGSIENDLLNGDISVEAWGLLSASLGFEIGDEFSFTVSKTTRALEEGEKVYIYYAPKYSLSKVRAREVRQNTETGEITPLTGWVNDTAREALKPEVIFSYGGPKDSAKLIEIYSADKNGEYRLSRTIER